MPYRLRARSRNNEELGFAPFVPDFNRKPENLLFAARGETMMSHRNTLRDGKRFLRQIGIRASTKNASSFRYTFAINYLRKRRVRLPFAKSTGVSMLEMTRRYANVLVKDLQAVHQRVSLPSR